MAKAKKRSPEKTSPEADVHAPAIVHEKIGFGMTEMTRTTYRLDRMEGAGRRERADGLRKLLLRSKTGFFGDLEENLREFLRESGVPDPTEDGKYPNIPHVTPDLAKQERASMQWYAAAILDELRKVDRHLARAAEASGRLAVRSSRINKATAEGLRKTIVNASHSAALAAYRAGTLNQEARGKSEHEETWTHGKGYRARQSRSGKGRGEQSHDVAERKWESVRAKAEEIRGRKPEIEGRRLARMVKTTMNLNDPVETIRKQIRKST